MDQRHQDQQSAQFSIAYVGSNCVEISRRILCNGAVRCVVNVRALPVGRDVCSPGTRQPLLKNQKETTHE